MGLLLAACTGTVVARAGSDAGSPTPFVVQPADSGTPVPDAAIPPPLASDAGALADASVPVGPPSDAGALPDASGLPPIDPPIGPPRIHPDDSHRFEWAGETWYAVGYYPAIGTLTNDADGGFHRDLIDRLAASGINYFRNVFTMGQQIGDSRIPYRRTGPGVAADGRPKYDLSQFDAAHFDYWRNVVSYARDRGVVIQITLLDAWHVKRWVTSPHSDILREWGLKYDFYQGANNINGVDVTMPEQWIDPTHPVFETQKALISRVIDELGEYPNIVWEVANEAEVVNTSQARIWERALADFVIEYETGRGLMPHLVMPRDIPNHESTPGHRHDPPATIHAELVARFTDGTVLISDNDCCTDPPGPAYQRHKAWAALTAGAHLDFFNFPMRDPVVMASSEVVDGMRYVGNLSRFLTILGVDLVGMTPSDGLVTSGWCYARMGEEYVVYLPTGGATTLSGLPTSVRATWFNPRDGSTGAAGAGPRFTAPDGNDWVLHAIRE